MGWGVGVTLGEVAWYGVGCTMLWSVVTCFEWCSGFGVCVVLCMVLCRSVWQCCVVQQCDSV